jgi:hypothetical protein
MLYLEYISEDVNKTKKEKLVVDQYNQGKTIRDIAKDVRISFRDIGSILKKESV